MHERGGGWKQLIALLAASVALSACGGGGAAAPSSSDVAAAAALTTTVAPSTTVRATAPVTTAPATTAATTSIAATTVGTTAAPASTTSTLLAATMAGADLRIDEMGGTIGDAPGTAPWVHIESVKCAGPIGGWPITVSGVRDMGELKFVLNGTGVATLAGTPAAASGTFTADYTLDVQGIPVSTGGEIAHIEGTAAWANGQLTLDGLVTGTSHGENPYHQVMMSMIPSTQVFVLTPTAGTYC